MDIFFTFRTRIKDIQPSCVLCFQAESFTVCQHGEFKMSMRM
jgi:hypothetical protein